MHQYSFYFSGDNTIRHVACSRLLHSWLTHCFQSCADVHRHEERRQGGCGFHSPIGQEYAGLHHTIWYLN
jgi:hypothetical protein